MKTLETNQNYIVKLDLIKKFYADEEDLLSFS